jgi:putative ABC transport system permease protein
VTLVPFSYHFRSVLVRRSSALLTIIGIGATVAILGGVLALEQGFSQLFSENGREDLVVFLRSGAMNEGESVIPREHTNTLIKSLPEIASNSAGEPLASAENWVAVRLGKVGGGETNVPVRGVGPRSFELAGSDLRISAGRRLEPGADEIIVGSRLSRRIRDCGLGQVLVLDATPFRVVGVFEHDGPFASEIGGDVDRLGEALARPGHCRVIAKLRPGVEIASLAERLAADPRLAVDVRSEKEYLASQTLLLSASLRTLGALLAGLMGLAAVFTATTTMFAVVSARTREVGILKSVGFRSGPIFLGFLLEALVLGLLGGALGCVAILPLNGVETGTTNFQTFAEVAFAFRITPGLLGTALLFALALGLLGGAAPAWRAARMSPVEALRRA